MPGQEEEKVGRNLKDWLESYMELVRDTEPPELFKLWTGISVIAAALQRKCKMERGFQRFFPNMYIVLLGPPASRKGTALGQGYYFLEQLDIPLASDSSTRAALIGKIKRTKKIFTDKITAKDIVHSSLTIFSPEFTVLIGYQDIGFLTALVDWYDCGRGEQGVWENDTIIRSGEKIYGIWINIIGATTPQLLREALPVVGIGGGFASRVLFINEQKKGKRISPKNFTTEQISLTGLLVNDLKQINSLNGDFVFEESCREEFDKWYETSCEEEPKLNQEKFAGYIGRRAAHCYKLMMICSASRSDEMIIRTEDFQRSLKYLTEIESRMDGTFQNFGKLNYAEELGKIIEMVKKKKRVTRMEIFKLFSNDVSDKTIDSIIETLKVMGLVKLVIVGNDIVLKLIEKEKK
jgi:hypothetical protein